MSVAAMSWAWKQALPPIEKYILVALSDHANDEDFTCWPSLSHLQIKTNLSRPTVWKAIDRLEKLDAVIRTGVHASGSTIYKINVGKQITYVGKEFTQGNDVTQVTTLPELGNVGTQVGNVGNKVGNDVTPNHKNHHESSVTIITKKSKSKRELVPEDFTITPDLTAWAVEHRIPVDLISSETPQFIDHHRSRGNKFIDFKAAWRTWMRNAAKWSAQRQGNANGSHKPIDNSAPARVQRRIAARNSGREAIDADSERVD